MLNKYWLAFVCLFPAISMAQFESQISDARSFVSSASPSSTSEALNSSFNSKATNIGSSDPILGGAKAPTTSGQGTLSQQGANNIAICNSNPSAPGCDAVKMMANYSPTNSISIKPNDPMLSAAQSAINANGAGGPFSPGTQCNPVTTTSTSKAAYTTQTCSRPAAVSVLSCNAALQPVVTTTTVPLIVTAWWINFYDWSAGAKHAYTSPTQYDGNHWWDYPPWPGCGAANYVETATMDGVSLSSGVDPDSGQTVFYMPVVNTDDNGNPADGTHLVVAAPGVPGYDSIVFSWGYGSSSFFSCTGFIGYTYDGGPASYGCADGSAPVNGACQSYAVTASYDDGCVALRNSANAGMPNGQQSIPAPQ